MAARVVVASEEAEQQTLAEYLDRIGVTWCHVPNGGARNKVTGARLKAMGVKPGVPDVLIFDPPPSHEECCGTAIELKRVDGGRVSDEQVDWLDKLRRLGWFVSVAKGAGEAIDLVQKLGYGRRRAG